MGTRGALGVFIDGKTKATYNGFDSYPSGLGADTVAAVRSIMSDPDRGIGWLKRRARHMEMWPDEQTPATPEVIERLKKYADTRVATGTLTDVYVLTRRMQGDIEAYLDAGFMVDGGEAFMADSLFCEFAYIINVDDGVLEFYRGFQRKPHEKGRYANALFEKEHRGDQQYYPVALVGSFPLDNIPDDWDEQLWPSEDDY